MPNVVLGLWYGGMSEVVVRTMSSNNNQLMGHIYHSPLGPGLDGSEGTNSDCYSTTAFKNSEEVEKTVKTSIAIWDEKSTPLRAALAHSNARCSCTNPDGMPAPEPSCKRRVVAVSVWLHETLYCAKGIIGVVLEQCGKGWLVAYWYGESAW